jgi:hypothetical protein
MAEVAIRLECEGGLRRWPRLLPGEAAEEVSTMAEVVPRRGSRGGFGDGQSHS